MDIKQAQKLIDEETNDLIDLCPHCGAKVHIVRQWSGYHLFHRRDVEFYIIFRCKPCQKLLLKTFFFRQNQYSSNQNLKVKGWREKFPLLLDHLLINEEKKLISEQVLSDYEEAIKCKAIGAHKASCAMFRRALQGSLVILGANPKLSLIGQIDSLHSLPDDIKDWAHQIRIFGNWGAHPDKDNLKDIKAEDVEEVYDFTSKFFIYVFIMPERVKLSRAKREERLKKSSEDVSDV